MKSIYLFCEFGVSIRTIKRIDESGIKFLDILNDPKCLDSVPGMTGYKKKHDIMKLIPNIINLDYDFSIFDLIKYDLSKNTIESLFEKKIKLADLYKDDYFSELKKMKYIGNSTIIKIDTALDKLVMENSSLKLNLNKDKLINILSQKKDCEYFDIISIQEDLKRYKFKLSELDDLLKELIFENKLIFCEDKYSFPLPKLKDELDKINLVKKDIIYGKFHGRTLESIGQEKGVTRERIRQIISNIINKLPKLYEDKYRNVFETYTFTQDLFCKLFQEDVIVYYYLKEKYHIGDLDPSELLDSDIINEEGKEIIRNNYNMILFNSETILVSKLNILVYILKYKECSMDVEELIDEYNNTIIKYNLENNLEFISHETVRNVERILSKSNKLIMSNNRKYRYYDLNELSKQNYENLESLLDTEAGAYSVEVFFNNSSLLMKELDIRSEYELHNIFRKLFYNKTKIVINKMPDILVDCDDKLNFIESKIKEMSPISVDEFCQFMYENYGHKNATLKSLISANFNKYVNINMLETDCPTFTAEQIEKIKVILNDDIYPMDDLKNILTNMFDVNDFSLINQLNLSQIGYKSRGNYIIRSSIFSLEEHLKNKILNNDYYYDDKRMRKCGSTYSSYIYKMIYNKDLFRLTVDKYVTIRKLNSEGIYKKDIDNLTKEIENVIIENQYFNLNILKEKIDFERFKFNELTDYFYETLISIINQIKPFAIDNNIMFLKSLHMPTRETFISSIIDEFKKVKVIDIKKYIENVYKISIHESNIRQYINKNRYYYHEGTDCVYDNKKMFDDEVSQWDILKFIN